MSTIDISAGTIHYEATGPETGRPVVFVHGYMMGGQLWRRVSERLAGRGLRCIAPTWPLGAHPKPLRPGADQTIGGVAGIVADVLAALELKDVVLVGNDTGGVVTQLVAVHYPERLGALVLTSCDAFEHFPPPILKPVILAAKSATLFRAAIQVMRAPAARNRAYAGLSHTTSTISPGPGFVRRYPTRPSPKTCVSSRYRCAPKSPPQSPPGCLNSTSRRSSRGRRMTCSSHSRTVNGSPRPSRAPVSR
ncbi:alpha/beta fold hydrolase [Mycobacterium tuberculosis]|uniref:alpha/beta fold hydrolase n=1 Tax=Mycobacterium tuberculosis TaxID=1773 RepID=UPI001F37F25F|nr:alpha/beta hydrolase [Mycobacterium tuberculosis]